MALTVNYPVFFFLDASIIAALPPYLSGRCQTSPFDSLSQHTDMIRVSHKQRKHFPQLDLSSASLSSEG